MTAPYFNWSDLQNDVEVMEEIIEGAAYIENKPAVEVLLTILICEYGLEFNDLYRLYKRILEIPGNPMDYVDEVSGQINFEPQE